MGKEWLLYWVSGNGGAAKSTKKRKSGGGSTEREPPSPGCMCSVFQLFDLHHFQFPLNHQTTLKTDSFLHFQDHEPSAVTKGVEAPRNSLELVETAACLPSATKEEEILNIPVGIQIKTSCENRSPRASTSSSKVRGEDLLSECSSGSPGAKTPNLVARLMGLDLLPESGSPSLSSSRRSTITNSHMHQYSSRHSLKQDRPRSRPFLQSRPCSRNNFYDNIDIAGGSVSLPETPRISSASRRSDVEQSRLSLQMNREHVGEELEYSAYAARKTGSRRRDVRVVQVQDENRSPAGSYHARNIVQQVKERVASRSRKVGLDITNTLKSREERRDEHVVLLKPKKRSPVLTRTEDGCGPSSKQTIPSCSPRLVRLFVDPKNKAITSSSPIAAKVQAPRLSPALSLSEENQSQVQEANVSLQKLRPQVLPMLNDQEHKSVQKCKKLGGNERFNSRLRNPPPTTASDAIRNKKEEPFIRPTTTNKLAVSVSEKKSSKRTPLSNELLPVSRKDSCLPLNKLRDKQQWGQNHDAQVSDALPWEGSSTTTRLSSCASRSYCPEEEVTHATTLLAFQENIRDKDICNGAAAASSSVDEMEFQYIKRILKRSGLDNATPVTLAKWFSPSHPLDPSIFHYMELFHPTTNKVSARLSHPSNRKLMFQLVDELLVEILKPYINPNPWIAGGGSQIMLYGSELIEQVCKRIKNFPSANCQVLEDIDALIEADLRKSKTSSYEEEEVGLERIASEIERDIMESLVHETSSTMLLS